MSDSRHLDERRIYDLADGLLDPAEESAAQAHLLRCEACRLLERECASVVESLRWYGAEPVAPPAGYWEEFWERWSAAREPVAARSIPRAGARFAPALAAAAALALLVGLWWTERPDPAEEPLVATASAPPLRQAMAEAGWADDYARFEAMSVAVGGVDPVSKGVVLASLAERP